MSTTNLSCQTWTSSTVLHTSELQGSSDCTSQKPRSHHYYYFPLLIFKKSSEPRLNVSLTMSTHVSLAHTPALFNDYIYCWLCRPMFIIVLIPKHTVLGAETRAQWVKRLLRKQRNLSSDPLHVCKSWTEQHTPMIPVLGEETAKFWGLSQHSQSGELQVLRKPVF